MTITHGNEITLPPEARFFLVPEEPLHRQYEALRAFFVDGQPSHEVARRFGYTPGAFRVLCHEFRHDPEKRSSFFQHLKHGPQRAPVRDRVRELAVALRKKNLSVYDIQHELAAVGHAISINALSLLMHEEGFERLPRRRDDERPVTLRPEAAPIANIKALDLSGRSFRTRSADSSCLCLSWSASTSRVCWGRLLCRVRAWSPPNRRCGHCWR